MRGALPVFFGKGKQGEVGDAQAVGQAGHHPDRFHAGHVAPDPHQPPALGPAAIAVHDNGDVTGDFLGVQRHRRFSQGGPPAP